jgi:hypothetical protein
MGAEQYGTWLLISSITVYFTLLQLGVPMAKVRFVSMYYAKGEIEKSTRLSAPILFFFYDNSWNNNAIRHWYFISDRCLLSDTC